MSGEWGQDRPRPANLRKIGGGPPSVHAPSVDGSAPLCGAWRDRPHLLRRTTQPVTCRDCKAQAPSQLDAALREDVDFSGPCPLRVGARVRITGVMPNEPAPLAIGEEGTVTGGNSGQVWVKWDSGRLLMLLPDIDPYEVLS